MVRGKPSDRTNWAGWPLCRIRMLFSTRQICHYGFVRPILGRAISDVWTLYLNHGTAKPGMEQSYELEFPSKMLIDILASRLAG
jgi:hypothetical protein